MADPIFWPGHLLKPQKISVDLAHRNLRTPSAANGFTQVVSNSAGLWKVSFSDIPVYNSQLIKVWRAIDTLSEGQLNPISLPVWDFPRSPGSLDDFGTNITKVVNQKVPFSDGSLFSDESGYVSSYTNITVAVDSVSGTTAVSLAKSLPLVTLEPGQRFSVSDRLYQIQRIISQTDSVAVVSIRPPLRKAITSGERAEFDMPRVRVKLTSDTSMSLPLNFNQQSFPALDFIEDV